MNPLHGKHILLNFTNRSMNLYKIRKDCHSSCDTSIYAKCDHSPKLANKGIISLVKEISMFKINPNIIRYNISIQSTLDDSSEWIIENINNTFVKVSKINNTFVKVSQTRCLSIEWIYNRMLLQSLLFK